MGYLFQARQETSGTTSFQAAKDRDCRDTFDGKWT